jgi:site-specific recombinase XerD
MFDRLLKDQSALARHRTSPLVEERLAYLTHLANQGYARDTLQRTASELLLVVKLLGLSEMPRKALTRDDVKYKTANHRHLFRLAVRWLKFLERLQQLPTPPSRFAKQIRAFVDHMKQEAFRPETIRGSCGFVTRFLDRLDVKIDSLHKITPDQIDMAFRKLFTPGGYSRTTIRGCASRLRSFFRFAETRGWCRRGLASAICAPRVYSQTSLPQGPSWDDVRRLLAMTEGDKPHNIRARAILMLLAIYGLRRGEVSRLRLEDFDWEHEVFQVISSKTGRSRAYPLVRSVGDAILRYLKEVRPRSSHREVFLSLRAPFRPVHTSLWIMVGLRLRSLNLSLPHYGPHALRHACATRLVAAGLSLKEIGDQLGHTDPDTTRIYAKVDLTSLREVADFDMGGVL